MISLLVLLVLSGSQTGSAGSGSCGRSERCCSGRDSSCVVNGGLQGTGSPCYCDEGCLETGDCCHDYKDVCSVKVVDCDLSSWSEWSSCDASCGKGTQNRSRVILQHPSPLGTPCGNLEQKRGCMGMRCEARFRRYRSPIAETAGLLPAKFLRRIKKPSWDVRENLFSHHRKMKTEAGYQSDQPANNLDYCVVFELQRVTKACRMDKDFYKMQKGQQFCAMCPEDARLKSLGDRCKGVGVDSQLTRWRSTVQPKCHGKWKRLYETDRCPCKAGADFIFV